VVKIAMLPDAQMVWLNPDLKVYKTEIHLDGEGNGLRTGMSCRASIVVEQYDDVVYIPVQSVVRIGDQPTAYIIKGGKLVPRKIEIGLDNNRMVHVKSGVEVGEIVALAPPLCEARCEIDPAQAGPPGSDKEAPPAATEGQAEGDRECPEDQEAPRAVPQDRARDKGRLVQAPAGRAARRGRRRREADDS